MIFSLLNSQSLVLLDIYTKVIHIDIVVVLLMFMYLYTYKADVFRQCVLRPSRSRTLRASGANRGSVRR